MNKPNTPESKSAGKVYTRTGDQGTTSLFGGARVMKDDPRLEAYGSLDELNSVIGILISDIENERWSGSTLMEVDRVKTELALVQSDLFVLGSHLATGGELAEDRAKNRSLLPRIEEAVVLRLEEAMDRMSVDLTPLKNFVLPGGTRPAASAHFARTIARRAERAIVASLLANPTSANASEVEEWQVLTVTQINRLNDYFFVLARHLNRLAHRDEPIWKPHNG
ncbi:MAG: cob(I)yrinic acid a,c-diamide adenosyltransferase [Deltaproteobacteria bacterium]|nr:cob(I)yrinic acid a,c-diamide adenosyltransferase [Deltaproteobacteria bacterium]